MKKRLLWGLAVLAVVSGAGLSSLAAAQEVPALEEIPADVAQARPDLAADRASLVSERANLRSRWDEQREKCKNVMENTDLWNTCIQLRGELQAALKAHIARSKAFNDSIHHPFPPG